MSRLLHETLFDTAAALPAAPALLHERHASLDYAGFANAVAALAAELSSLGVHTDDRVGVFLDKQPLTPVSFYAATMTGGVFVPLNPVLRPAQVAYILRDCDVKVLVTSPQRLAALESVLADCPGVEALVLSAEPESGTSVSLPGVIFDVADRAAAPAHGDPARRIDQDMAAILYTSGSTGKPKGVVISHRNIVEGAVSVRTYLGIDASDRLLAVLPFSFDYGLNQLTTAVLAGASCVLLDYLLPRDVVKAVAKHRVTGLAAVPPLWSQLARLDWPDETRDTLRYFTNSGGAMPIEVLAALRAKLPDASPVLMYGLTEAFRSTYLPPEKIDERPGSMGKAIPNAEILVVDPTGRPVGPNEPGELVHRGVHVALGYWNDPERTAERFRPVPGTLPGLTLPELAVWSGDTVTMDEDGYLYFVGRTDAMIKTSGYRVSPEEVEEIAYGDPDVVETAAIGAPDPDLGQSIVLIVCLKAGSARTTDELIARFREAVPAYMVPARIVISDEMPHNANGKIDRNRLTELYAGAN